MENSLIERNRVGFIDKRGDLLYVVLDLNDINNI